MDFYRNDFEVGILEHTEDCYSWKDSLWVSEDSYMNYMQRSKKCIIDEMDIVARYMLLTSEHKARDKVENALLYSYMTHFMKDEHSSYITFLRNQINYDILMMRVFFGRIPND